jgi:Predicted metal-dependent hydrolase with the TIM-barrel fold
VVKSAPIICFLFIFFSSHAQQKVDLLVFNAKVYTVDSAFTIAEAFAINGGKIIDVGKTKILQSRYEATKKLDAHGNFIYPGFIDAHTHFVQYGLTLQEANLVGTVSWDDIISKIKLFATNHSQGWLIGHGWDQNDWALQQFPDNKKLNELFPDRPVLLKRIDGHAIIVNDKALAIAGIKQGDVVDGGEVEVKNNKLTGILVDNATHLVYSKMPGHSLEEIRRAILDAQQNCFRVGLTTVDDCGLDYPRVLLLDEMQKAGALKMRIYAMLSDDKNNYDFLFEHGKIKTERLNVRSFKVYADGALGSRGACLLEPYLDQPGWTGFLLNSPEHMDSVANLVASHGFQMCTHAIGDSGNRTILKIYARYLKGKNDMRWRIEHAQVINKNDFHLFGDNSIIPSVQPTHATSDMYWVKERLGNVRVKGAYAYHDLLKENGWIPLGTDFPVEDISPVKTFFAAVARKDAKGWPKNGFQVENALSRKEALRGITIWAAKSNFEESEKGSIEKGKFADFILVNKDLVLANEKDILKTTVLATFVNGEKVFERK